MGFDIKSYEALYPICYELYKYKSRNFFQKFFTFYLSYKIKISTFKISIRRFETDPDLKNTSEEFMEKIGKVKNNRNNLLLVFSKFEDLFKDKLYYKFFGLDRDLQEKDINRNKRAAEQLEKDKKEIEEKLIQKERELEEENKKREKLQEMYDTLQLEKQLKDQDNFFNNVNSQDEIKNQDGNKDDDRDTIVNSDMTELGKIRISYNFKLLEKQNKQLLKELSEVKKENEKKDKEIDDLKKKNIEYEEEIIKQNIKISELEEEKSKLKIEIESLNAKIESLNKNLKDNETEINK